MSNDTNENSSPQDPYLVLGIKQGANFDEIQEAKQKRLEEAGDSQELRTKIESSYDALLMQSLKQRQSGKVSSEAYNASKQEQKKVNSDSGLAGSLLTRIKNNIPNNNKKKQIDETDNSFSINSGATVKLSIGLLCVLIALTSPPGINQLTISASIIGIVISQVKSGKKLLESLGWSVVFLAIGMIFGDLVTNNSSVTNLSNVLTVDHIKSSIAVFCIWLGSIFI